MGKFLKIVGGFVFFIALLVVPFLLLGGALAFFARFGENLFRVCGWLFILTVGMLLLTPIRALRRPVGNLIYLFTYLWGASVWLFSAYICYSFWGVLGLIVGLILMGVGVAPVALAALLFNGYFQDAGALLLAIVIVFGFRFVALALQSSQPKVREEQYFTAFSGRYAIDEHACAH